MKRLLGILVISFAAGCSLVDEDLSDCPDELTIDYEMRLVTNVQTEISSVLNRGSDPAAAGALRNYFRNIFSDYAHDVDLFLEDKGCVDDGRASEREAVMIRNLLEDRLPDDERGGHFE